MILARKLVSPKLRTIVERGTMKRLLDRSGRDSKRQSGKLRAIVEMHSKVSLINIRYFGFLDSIVME
jgi:hypothetical protein